MSKVYVGTQKKYNNASLGGGWLDLTDYSDKEEFIQACLELHEDEEDLRCQVMLRHRNAGKLRRLYEKIVESTDANADSFVASEATRDFMARLRIGIMVDQAPPPDASDGPPKDIVFLQDVIARHARLEWCLEDARPEPIEAWIPPRWARRRPAAMDDMKSIVYLCCPVASKEVWAFRTAVSEWRARKAVAFPEYAFSPGGLAFAPA